MTISAFENLSGAVMTINTPMPYRIDEETLIGCLKGEVSDRRWRGHVQALFDEVDVFIIHGLVLDKLVSFKDLLDAIDTWHVTESENERWVREMASFEMGDSSGEGSNRSR